MSARFHRPILLPAFGFSFAAFAAVLGGSFALFSGCGLQTSGLPSLADGGSDAHIVACTSAAQCDDQNACTTDTCTTAGICSSTPVADGQAPAASQVAGDCQVITCTGGVATNAPDDTDVPAAPDMCTAVSCSGGKAQQMPQPDGTMCTLSGSPGICATGTCTVACKTTADCPSKGACQTAGCDGSKGVCVYQNVADGTLTPGLTQQKGDCHTHVCISGMDTSLVDDGDVPPSTDCQDAQCNNGTPVLSFTNHPSGAPCSSFMTNKPGFCDGMGHCNQCTMDSQCTGTTDDCQHPTCNLTTGLCVTAFTPAGTKTTQTPAQVPGDCHAIECDGSGGTTNKVDDTDVPTFSTVCKTGMCSNGTPSTTINNGIKCGGGVCNASGQCGCTMDTDCQPPAYEKCGGGGTAGVCGCTPVTCGSVTCGSIPDGCGGMLSCNDGKPDGTETDVDCGGTAGAGSTCAVKCAQGKKCKVATDCASGFCTDGVCCNVACTGAGFGCQACSAAAKGQGADGVCGAVVAGSDPHSQCAAEAMSTCGKMGGCNGAGACTLWPDGTPCSGTSCKDMQTQNNPKTCVGGACTAPAVATTSCVPYACVGAGTGACATSCGMTPYTDTECAMGAYCDGMGAGVCHARLMGGVACTNDDECSSGQCLGGFCCAAKCTGTTGTTCGPTACAMTTGACQYPAALTNCGMGTCNGGNMLSNLGECDGAGSCKGIGKYTCPAGKCGSAGCTACNMDSDCTAYGYCSGAVLLPVPSYGTCKPKGQPGASCTGNNQCLSNMCSGGQCK